jgi:MaoC like domain
MFASKVFDSGSRRQFAELSGDLNPIHIDSIIARRTYAGAPIAHGMHLLLWLLDEMARAHHASPNLQGLKVQFRNVVYLGEQVDAHLLESTDNLVRYRLRVAEAIVADVSINLGLTAAAPSVFLAADELLVEVIRANDVPLGNMRAISGTISTQTPLETLGAMFGAAVRWLGADAVSALARSSYVVGMLVPGLHSIYGGLDLVMVPTQNPGTLSFAVGEVDVRFRRVSIEVVGGGWNGVILAFVRVPPVEQPSVDEAAGRVEGGEFRAVNALIVGGSRGLGELTAKLIGAGGGHCVITYAAGADDARRVAAEIAASGGRCDVLSYDISLPAEEQLRSLRMAPNQIHYYASPSTAGRVRQKYSQLRFENFSHYFVRGFRDLILAADQAGWTFTAHYPSSVDLDAPRLAWKEFAHAKAAGEALCAELNRSLPRNKLVISRLPPLATDQSVSLVRTPSGDSIGVLLPIIREMNLAVP